MAQLKITTELAEKFFAARSNNYNRKAEKTRLMKLVHDMFPAISRRVKLRIATENPNNPLYCVLRDKHTGVPFDDGQPEPLELAAPLVSTATAVSPAKKAAAKKPVAAKKTVAAKAKPVVKPKAPAKVTKPAAKPVKAKAKAVAAAKPAKASSKPVAAAKAKAKK